MAVKTIGATGDFSTPQSWLDSWVPATLLENEEGQCQNQEFVATTTPIIAFGAHTTGAFRITLTTVAGASFQDNANARTNALRYNAANGCGFRNTGYNTPVVSHSGANIGLTISKLQIRTTGTGTLSRGIFMAASSTNLILKDLIVEAFQGEVLHLSSTAGKCINVLAISHNTSTFILNNANGFCAFIGCAFVRPSNLGATGNGAIFVYGTPTFTSCIFIGCNGDVTGTCNAASNNNATTATDAASGLPDPATDNNVYSASYAVGSPFINATDASEAHDFRLADDGNALLNAGLLDGTNAPNDITGYARANPPDIGQWELTHAAGPSVFPYYAQQQQ